MKLYKFIWFWIKQWRLWNKKINPREFFSTLHSLNIWPDRLEWTGLIPTLDQDTFFTEVVKMWDVDRNQRMAQIGKYAKADRPIQPVSGFKGVKINPSKEDADQKFWATHKDDLINPAPFDGPITPAQHLLLMADLRGEKKEEVSIDATVPLVGIEWCHSALQNQVDGASEPYEPDFDALVDSALDEMEKQGKIKRLPTTPKKKRINKIVKKSTKPRKKKDK